MSKVRKKINKILNKIIKLISVKFKDRKLIRIIKIKKLNR